MTDDSDPETTDAAEVLAVLATLAATGCRAWVAGGWGVDALVGRTTRAHRDLDLALDAAGLDVGLKSLTALGYLVETDWRPVRVELHRPQRGRVDVHPVVFDPDGNGVQAGFDGDVFRYPRDCFAVGRIADSMVGCLSADQQRTFRQGYPLRPVDHHDLALLEALPDPPPNPPW
jgi:lincosamide nucleotidyltransferase A/C/D/E